jgi:hypothetical protein
MPRIKKLRAAAGCHLVYTLSRNLFAAGFMQLSNITFEDELTSFIHLTLPELLPSLLKLEEDRQILD